MAGYLSKSQRDAEGKIDRLTWFFSNKIVSDVVYQIFCSTFHLLK